MEATEPAPYSYTQNLLSFQVAEGEKYPALVLEEEKYPALKGLEEVKVTAWSAEEGSC